MNNPKYYQHRYTHTKDVYLKVGESDDGKTLILENKVSGVRFIATSAMYEQVEQEVRVVGVQFIVTHGRTYTYMCDDLDLIEGDHCIVNTEPVRNKIAKVIKVDHIKPSSKPFPLKMLEGSRLVEYAIQNDTDDIPF